MKLRQLRYFVTIVETGSVTAAAHRLNVSQPALSSAMRALEDELGGGLVERKRSLYRLTSLGAKFYDRALRILNECEIAKNEFKGGLAAQHVKVGVLQTIPIGFILEFRRILSQWDASVDFSFRDDSVSGLLAGLSSGRIDVAVLALDAARGGGWEPLFEEPMAMVCPPGHPLSRDSSIGIQALDGEDFVLRTHCEFSQDAQEILGARGVRPRIVLRTDQDGRAFEAVRSQLGVTIAPVSLVNDLPVIPFEDLGLSRTVGTHISGRLSPVLAEIFVRTLREASATLAAAHSIPGGGLRLRDSP